MYDFIRLTHGIGIYSSVTLVGESDRKLLKSAIKHAAGEDQVRHRQIPAEAVARWAQKIDSLKNEISEILREEKEEKQVRGRNCITDVSP